MLNIVIGPGNKIRFGIDVNMSTLRLSRYDEINFAFRVMLPRDSSATQLPFLENSLLPIQPCLFADSLDASFLLGRN